MDYQILKLSDIYSLLSDIPQSILEGLALKYDIPITPGEDIALSLLTYPISDIDTANNLMYDIENIEPITLLGSLPPEMGRQVVNYLGPNDILSLSRTERNIRSQLLPEVDVIRGIDAIVLPILRRIATNEEKISTILEAIRYVRDHGNYYAAHRYLLEKYLISNNSRRFIELNYRSSDNFRPLIYNIVRLGLNDETVHLYLQYALGYENIGRGTSPTYRTLLFLVSVPKKYAEYIVNHVIQPAAFIRHYQKYPIPKSIILLSNEGTSDIIDSLKDPNIGKSQIRIVNNLLFDWFIRNAIFVYTPVNLAIVNSLERKLRLYLLQLANTQSEDILDDTIESINELGTPVELRDEFEKILQNIRRIPPGKGILFLENYSIIYDTYRIPGDATSWLSLVHDWLLGQYPK